MAKKHHEIEIAAPTDRVWGVLGDLAATSDWLPGIVSARVEGNMRYCLTPEKFEIREEISDRSDRTRSYRYRHQALPAPITGSQGVYRVVPAGEGSRVLWDSEFEPADPAKADEIVTMIDGYYQQTLASLKRFVETGKRWNEP